MHAVLQNLFDSLSAKEKEIVLSFQVKDKVLLDHTEIKEIRKAHPLTQVKATVLDIKDSKVKIFVIDPNDKEIAYQLWIEKRHLILSNKVKIYRILKLKTIALFSFKVFVVGEDK